MSRRLLCLRYKHDPLKRGRAATHQCILFTRQTDDDTRKQIVQKVQFLTPPQLETPKDIANKGEKTCLDETSTVVQTFTLIGRTRRRDICPRADYDTIRYDTVY